MVGPGWDAVPSAGSGAGDSTDRHGRALIDCDALHRDEEPGYGQCGKAVTWCVLKHLVEPATWSAGVPDPERVGPGDPFTASAACLSGGREPVQIGDRGGRWGPSGLEALEARYLRLVAAGVLAEIFTVVACRW